ncbi:MAG: hypothetical protein ACYDHX_12410 [Methanothrix sp.]
MTPILKVSLHPYEESLRAETPLILSPASLTLVLSGHPRPDTSGPAAIKGLSRDLG